MRRNKPGDVMNVTTLIGGPVSLPNAIEDVTPPVINPLGLPAIRYIGPGRGVYFEKRSISGENLVMVKGHPVVIGESVSPEYAEQLVAAGKVEYCDLASSEPDQTESAEASSEDGENNTPAE